MKSFATALSTLIYLFVLNANAQVLDSTVAIKQGQSAQINVINNAINIPSGNPGANQIYDYSSLPAFNSTYNITGVANSSSPFGSSYPNANATVSWSSSGSPYYHFILSDTAYIYLGGGSSFGSYQYTDTYEQLRFPFAYLDSYTDSFVAVSNTGGIRAGSVTVLGDGYGDLLLQGQVFSGVLRVKRVSAYRDTINGTPRLTQETYYEYYKQGIPHYILLHGFYTITSGSSNPVSGSQLFYNVGAFITSASNQNNDQPFFTIIDDGNYCMLNYRDNHTYNSELCLYNMQGQLLWHEAIQISQGINQKALPNYSLPAGMYFLKFNDYDGNPRTIKWAK